MSGHHASSSDSRIHNPASPPALRLLKGGRTPLQQHPTGTPEDTGSTATNNVQPAMAVRIRMICRMLDVDPNTEAGTRMAMQHIRFRRLAVARSVTRSGRIALTERTPRMPFVYWEVFGQFGRVAPMLIGATIRAAERTLGRVGSGRNDSRFVRKPVDAGRRATPGPVEVISAGRIIRQAS